MDLLTIKVTEDFVQHQIQMTVHSRGKLLISKTKSYDVSEKQANVSPFITAEILNFLDEVKHNLETGVFK